MAARYKMLRRHQAPTDTSRVTIVGSYGAQNLRFDGPVQPRNSIERVPYDDRLQLTLAPFHPLRAKGL